MIKNEQEIVNQIISNEKARAELELYNYHRVSRLLSCQAFVYETDNYFWLRYYDTFVAFIEKATDTCYDILRMVYGYTATSAKHIAKFRHVYGADYLDIYHNGGVHQSYTYREV